MCNCKCMVITGVIAAIGIFLGVYFGFITQEAIDDLLDKASDVTDDLKDRFTDILDSDPFTGQGEGSGAGSDPNEVSDITWPSSKNTGLNLEIVNALDERWMPYFEKAVLDWENGDPDALTLSTSTTSPDSSCKAIEGKMKVCNGDYGATGWRGVNEIVWDYRNEIIESVAKMNEYYLDDSSSHDEKQYTMCHEIGHGFGLMHTDENFMNSPLGDCMDYSNNLQPNLLPGLVNYQKLANMYGTLDGKWEGVPVDNDNGNGNGDTEEKNKNGGKNLRRSLTLTSATTSSQSQSTTIVGEGGGRGRGVPKWVRENFIKEKESLVLGRENRTDGPHHVDSSDNNSSSSSNENNDNNNSNHHPKKTNNWKVLYKSELGEIHQVHLGGGYYGHVRALLA